MTVRLATSPAYAPRTRSPQSLGQVRLELEALPSFLTRGPGIPVQRFVLPPPNSSAQDVVQMPPGMSDLRFVLRCGPDRMSWVIGSIGPDDILTIVGGQSPQAGGMGGSQQSMYFGSVFHVGQRGANPCEVRCDAGPVTPDDCCIVCTSGDATIKFCC